MNEQREMVWVSGESLDFNDNRIDAAALQTWLAAELAKVPDELRASAYIQGSASGGYGDTTPDCESITVYYERPETDEEMNGRISRHRAYAAKSEARERADYERLKAKFGER